MTVRQLLTSLDSKELSEWMAYFEIENENMKNKKGADDTAGQSLETKIKGTFAVFGKGVR